MAGKLTISTLNDSSGVLATQNGMTGIAKAWVRFTALSGTVVIKDSFNISSVTRTTTGTFTLAFTTAMPNANYSAVGASGLLGNNSFIGWMNTCTGTAPTTSSFNIITSYGTLADPDQASVSVFSS
jgi:hypothetical protein